jgi:hypothetical protein
MARIFRVVSIRPSCRSRGISMIGGISMIEGEDPSKPLAAPEGTARGLRAPALRAEGRGEVRGVERVAIDDEVAKALEEASTTSVSFVRSESSKTHRAGT